MVLLVFKCRTVDPGIQALQFRYIDASFSGVPALCRAPLHSCILADLADVITVQPSPSITSFFSCVNFLQIHRLPCAGRVFRNGSACVASRRPFIGTETSPRTPQPFDTGFIEQLISAAIDVIFSPIEALFAPLIDPLVELIGLPDIGFNSQSVSFGRRPARNAVVCLCMGRFRC